MRRGAETVSPEVSRVFRGLAPTFSFALPHFHAALHQDVKVLHVLGASLYREAIAFPENRAEN